MPDAVLMAVTFAAAVGAALIAGVFFAFSTFVMKALGRLPAHEGLAAMQSINIVVLNPMFLGVFLGTAALCLATTVGAGLHWQKPGAAFLLAGGLLYLVGTFGVTVVCNVPMNDALAPLAPTDPAAAAQWADYLGGWTLWNHVRTAAALLAAVSFIVALRR